jgi:glycosyltransferase involved in cell wall biosynthesis
VRWPTVVSKGSDPALNSGAGQQKLRIIFCTLGYAPGPGGGAEQQARLQAEELVRRGHWVTVVCPSSPGVGSGEHNGVRVVRLPWPHRRWYLREVTYLPVLAAFLAVNARKFDLCHVHLASRQADVAVLAARPLGCPVYVKVAGGGRGREISPTRTMKMLTRQCGLRNAGMVQAISEPIARELCGIGVDDSKIVRIPNGLATTRWSQATPEKRSAARRSLDLPEDAVIVLFAGRFARQKGLRDLLDAWAATPDLHRAKLVLVGSPAADDPTGPIQESDHVIVRDWTEEIRQYYWAADILVLPSYAEGMSNTLLEAMCSGLAVVATTVGAATEMIQPEIDGFLVEPGDKSGLAKVLTRLIEDADLRQRVGAAAAATVRSRFAIEGVVDQIERRYQELIAKS